MAPQQPHEPGGTPEQPYEPGRYRGGRFEAGPQEAGSYEAGPYEADGSGGAAGAGEAVETGEIRAAERSAHRAAAVAAAEDFHPLRIRPYVVAEAADGGGPSPDPADGPATTDLGLLFPPLHSAVAYDRDEDPAPDGAAPEPPVHGRHRRRRRGLVVAAAAVAASALAAGAVAVTGQLTSDAPGRSDLALPDQSTSMPDATLPPSQSARGNPVTHPAAPRSASAPSGTASVTSSPATAATAAPPAAPAAPPPAAARNDVLPPSTDAPSAPLSAPTVDPAPTQEPSAPVIVAAPGQSAPPTTAPTTPPTVPPPPTAQPAALSAGDSGPAVVDLQRRLTEVGLYPTRTDGVFDWRLQQSVTVFQLWHLIGGDPLGVYGSHTRTFLEQQTS